MAIDRQDAARTALRLLDEDGLEKLSLRRIATELHVQAPALYWHFANKRALLDHITDLMLAPALPELEGPAVAEEWPLWLMHTARVLRRELLAHPDGARVALGADLRRAIALGMFFERSIEVLHAAGFGLPDASRAAGAFIAFVIGRTAEEQALPDIDTAEGAAAADLFPTLSRAMAERRDSGDTQDESFRFSVTIMIAGLRALHRELPPTAAFAQLEDQRDIAEADRVLASGGTPIPHAEVADRFGLTPEGLPQRPDATS